MSGTAGSWKKGQSGNPGGRTKGHGRIRDLAQVHTDLALKTLAKIAKDGESESARVAAAEALLNRGWGKPTQPVSGDDDMPPLLIERIERVLVRADSENQDSSGI